MRWPLVALDPEPTYTASICDRFELLATQVWKEPRAVSYHR
jgi:hypothetical protein